MGYTGGHGRLAGGAPIHARRTGLLFGSGDRDRADVALGIPPAIAPNRGADVFGFRPDGRFALRSRSQHIEPPGDDDEAHFERLPIA